MDATLFAQMLSDKHLTNLKKLGYKYPTADLHEFTELLHHGFYADLPLRDFDGEKMVYLPGAAQVHLSAAKSLLIPQTGSEAFGAKAMEEEISATFTIESIDFARDSVRRILKGYAPADESEQRILGMKKGLEFIADPGHKITEKNLHTLYQLAIGETLPAEDALPQGALYRNDSVYIVGQSLEHTGLAHQKLPAYMAELVQFSATDDPINDLLKAAIIHFYIAYLHPYFDGNGRIARLVHLWYLVQQGYPSALFIPLSGFIERSRRAYYNAYTLCEENQAISGVLDATPFLVYFIENVYSKLTDALPAAKTTADFQDALADGKITEKESALWQFVLSAYGNREFSTKQLEKDFGNAAYATIRGFVLKFEQLGLLTGQKYGNKMKYHT